MNLRGGTSNEYVTGVQKPYNSSDIGFRLQQMLLEARVLLGVGVGME